MACPCGVERYVHRRLHYKDNTGAHPTTLQANGLCHNLAVDIGIAIDHFALFGTAEIELEIVSWCSLANTLRFQQLEFGRKKLTKGPDMIRQACCHRRRARPPSGTNGTLA
jgi:hypothetical protein